MMTMSPGNTANLNIKGGDYPCIVSRISKSGNINLMQNINLTKKVQHFLKIKIYYHI